MRNEGNWMARLVPAVFLAVVCGITNTGWAQEDPNTAGNGVTDLSDLNLGTAQEVLNRLYGYLAEYGLKILAAILIFVIGRWVARLLANLAARRCSRPRWTRLWCVS